MATTISKLFSTGILQSSVVLDEVSYGSIKVGTNGVFASEFDEVNLTSGPAERKTNTGTYQVKGYFDEYTLAQPVVAPALLSYDGTSLTGWTQVDGTATIDATIGNPTSSWKVTGRGFFRDLGVNLLNKTFTFDIRLAAGADGGIVFCNNAGGSGTYRAAIRAFQPGTTPNGIRLGSNGGWLYIGQTDGVVASYFPTANAWYTVKLQIGSDRICTWFINGVQQATTVTIPVGYTSANATDNYFGFISNVTGAINYDNFSVYDGII